MTGTYEKEQVIKQVEKQVEEQIIAERDFDLGIVGFRYSDLFDAVKLKELADKFYSELFDKEPVLAGVLTKYIAAHGNGHERRSYAERNF